jgi:hypothetical protein
MAPADVSVVVVTLDGLPWIERCLESVRGSRRSSSTTARPTGRRSSSASASRGSARRAGEPRLRRRQHTGMRLASGRWFLLLNADAWSSADSVERLVAFGDAHPDAAVVGPRPAQHRTDAAQRSVRAIPQPPWRLATEYLFIRKLAPRSHVLNPYYAGDFDHGGPRVEWVGPVLPRPPRGGRPVGLSTRLLPVQRGDRLVLPLPRGGLARLVHCRARGRARRRREHGGECTSRTSRRSSLFAKHHGPSEAARVRRLLRVALGCAGSCFPASAGACTATPPARCDRAVPWELLALPALGIARAAAGNRGGLWARLSRRPRACSCRARSSRGRSGAGFSAAFAWALGALFAAMTVVFARPLVAAAGAGAARASSRPLRSFGPEAVRPEGLPLESARRVASALRASASGSRSGPSRAPDRRGRLFHLARVRKLSTSAALAASRRRVPGRRAPPRLRVPALALVPRARRQLGGRRPERVVSARGEPCSCRRVPRRLGGGQAVFRSAWGGLAVLARRSRSSRWPPGRRLVHRARPARRRSAGSCSSRP